MISMYDYKLETLIARIKNADCKNSLKREALKELKASLDDCVLYMRTAIVSLVQTYVTAWDEATHEDEQLLQEFNIYRRNAHDRCLQACKRINDLCDKYEAEHIFPGDTDDEYETDKAVGSIVSEMYKRVSSGSRQRKGLQRNKGIALTLSPGSSPPLALP